METNVKLISKDGDFLSILYRISQEDIPVTAYMQNPSNKMYDNMIEKVHTETELDITPDSVVVFDMVGAGEAADILKQKGYRVVGGSSLADEIELDRYKGTEFMEAAGIRTPKSYLFDSFEELGSFLDKNPADKYVFKPHGNLETDLTLPGYTSEYMKSIIPYLRERCGEDVTFEIQEFVEGVEMSTEAWFNGQDFIRPINSTMESKGLMEGNKGPATGCAGNTVWYWDAETSEFLYRYLFEGMVDKLREDNYVGPIDVNGIWAPDGIYGLEFTARFGYDAIQAMTRLLQITPGEFITSLDSIYELPVKEEQYSHAIRLSIPPYPLDGDVPNLPINIIDQDKYSDNIYLSDVMLDDEGMLKCAGSDGYIMCIAEDSMPLQRLISKTLHIAEGIEIPSLQYRRDTGDRVIRDRQKIEAVMLDIHRKA